MRFTAYLALLFSSTALVTATTHQIEQPLVPPRFVESCEESFKQICPRTDLLITTSDCYTYCRCNTMGQYSCSSKSQCTAARVLDLCFRYGDCGCEEEGPPEL